MKKNPRMLLRHSAAYLVARGVPGLVGFATIIIYTRLLSPEAYGQYALVFTGAVLCNAVLYQWLSASLLRFLPQYKGNESDFLNTIFIGFICASFLTGVCGALLALLWGDSEWCRLILAGVLLVWAQAWYMINLELVRSRLAPIRYGLISMLKAIVTIGLGVALVLLDYDTYGALAGLFVGFLVAGIWSSWGQWSSLRGWKFNSELVKKLLSYGLPLTASFALAVVISSTDRFMLAGMIDESATGLYAAGQGLAQQAVGVLMSMVNLAAYPLILRTLEKTGYGAACAQLRKNAILLLCIGFPVATVFIVLAPNISKIFLGKEFQAAGIELMPWFAISALVSSLRTYYFDLAFYLGKKTHVQVMVMGVAAFLNVVLNFWLIPVYGLMGAVYGSVVAQVVAAVLSVTLGRWVFCLPMIYNDFFRLLLAVLTMAVVLFLLPKGEDVSTLVLSVFFGVVTYLGSALVLNPGGVRAVAFNFFTKNMCKHKGGG